jgi:hypothetical protein
MSTCVRDGHVYNRHDYRKDESKCSKCQHEKNKQENTPVESPEPVAATA